MGKAASQSHRKLSKIPQLLLSSIALVIGSGCSIFGVESVEEAPFVSVRKEKPFEVRDYASIVVAETRVAGNNKSAGNKAFRALFRYISGDNEGSQKIAMTAPVLSENDNTSGGKDGEKIAMTAPVTFQQEGELWRYRFVLPKNFTIDNAPRPTNPNVVLVEVPSKQVATLRYSGRATEKAQAKQAEVLVKWVSDQGLEAESEPRWAGYNAPWTLPWFRRNEVLIDVSGQ